MNVDDLYHCQNAQKLFKFSNKDKNDFVKWKTWNLLKIFDKVLSNWLMYYDYYMPLMIIFICNPY
jgi:hypothetical protein